MYLLIAVILFSLNISLGTETQNSTSTTTTNSQTQQVMSAPALPIPKLPENHPMPDLGSCSEYTDYYIHECKPFHCSMPLAKHPGATREMTTIGFEKDKCIHQIKIKARHHDFRQTDIKINCRLSVEGRTEMAKLFTRYKKGDITAYTNKHLTSILGKECHQ